MEGLNKEMKSYKGQLLSISGILNFLTVLSLDILNFSLKLGGVHNLDVLINALLSRTTPNKALEIIVYFTFLKMNKFNIA